MWRTNNGVCFQPWISPKIVVQLLTPRESLWNCVIAHALHHASVPKAQGTEHLLPTSGLKSFFLFLILARKKHFYLLHLGTLCLWSNNGIFLICINSKVFKSHCAGSVCMWGSGGGGARLRRAKHRGENNTLQLLFRIQQMLLSNHCAWGTP